MYLQSFYILSRLRLPALEDIIIRIHDNLSTHSKHNIIDRYSRRRSFLAGELDPNKDTISNVRSSGRRDIKRLPQWAPRHSAAY